MGSLKMFPGITPLDHDPDVMLKLAQGNLSEVVILGYDKDGKFFFSSNKADGGHILWLIELAKHELLNLNDRE